MSPSRYRFSSNLLAIAIAALLGVAAAASASAQQVYTVPITSECVGGNILLAAHTYDSDPFCDNYATAPGGGCTQWHLFLNGVLETSEYTVPAAGGVQVPPNPPLAFYNSGSFTIHLPGSYQIFMSYSRLICTGWWIFQHCHFQSYVNQTQQITLTAADLNPASWFNRCPLGSFDGANCFVMAVPPGGFIYGNGFYEPAAQSSNCPKGSFDGAHCFIMPIPPGGFIYHNGFYEPAGSGGHCALGTFDGAHCLILEAPWGTTAFEFAGNFYTTTLPSCAAGSYDGANCLLATVPLGTSPFIWHGNFYVTPRPPCQ